MARKTNLLLENAENDDIRFSINGNGSSITNTYINKGDDISKIDAGFSFAYPSSLSGVGVFNDDITIDICYDNSCQYHLDGSPLKISTKYEINFDPPEGVDTANIVDKQELKHDIVDAEYSKSLDAVVMVSSYPDNAVYIYNVNNKTEQKINLNKPPKAVSVDFVNSRKRFAIGHDSGATIVDYNDVDPGSSVVKYIVVSVNVYDLAVNQDNVFIVPSEGQWVDLIELDILNETESYGDYLIDDNSKIKLHASGNSVYTTETNSSPIDIEKFDISNSPP